MTNGDLGKRGVLKSLPSLRDGASQGFEGVPDAGIALLALVRVAINIFAAD